MKILNQNKRSWSKKKKILLVSFFIFLILGMSIFAARTVLAASAGIIFFGKTSSVIAVCTPPPGNPCNAYGLTTPYVVVATASGFPPQVGIIPGASLGTTKVPKPGAWIIGFGIQQPSIFVATVYWMY